MPDTAREKAALITAFATTGTKAITAQQGRDLIVSTHPAAVDLSGPFASRPTTGLITGMVYRSTDGPYTQRFNGTTWDTWAYGMPVTPPDPTAFTGINMTGATVDSSAGPMFLGGPTVYPAQAWHIQKQAAPSTPYTVTLGFLPLLPIDGATGCGLCFRDSGTGKLSSIEIRPHTGTLELVGFSFTNPTTYADIPFAPSLVSLLALGGMVWFRIADDGTNRVYSYSADGLHFTAAFSFARTAFLTADEVGFYVNTHNDYLASGGLDCGINAVSWKVG